MRRRRDESGAVAVLVALLATVLFGMLAFVADLGMAYANKHQLQTAADAAVLAAASELTEYAGGCAAVTGNPTATAAARAEAAAKVTENYIRSEPATVEGYTVECTDEGLLVRTSLTSTSPVFFGGLFGAEDYDLSRSAAAVVDVPGRVSEGARPLAICSADLAAVASLPSAIVRLDGPGGGHRAPNACPDAGRAGNWWSVDCPEDSSNGGLADNVRHGCDSPVSIVPGQPPTSDPGLSEHLTDYCGDARNESCLSSNPGNLRGQVPAAFQSLVDSGETVYLPVFCGRPHCSPAAVSPGGGNNVVYPLHKLIAVQICGYHLGNRDSGSISDRDNCTSANNPNGHDPRTGSNQDNYLLVVVKQVQISGSTGPSSCRIGDPCDGGLRRVRLTKGPYDH